MLLSPGTWILLQLRAGREKSFSPSCANFLMSTKRHLNHLSVRNGSSRKRRQAGRQNKQPTLLHPTYLGINGQKQRGEATDGLLNPLCSHQRADRFGNKTAKQYGACGDSAQRSVNEHFHAERLTRCQVAPMNVERQREQSASLRLAEKQGHRRTHKQPITAGQRLMSHPALKSIIPTEWLSRRWLTDC